MNSLNPRASRAVNSPQSLWSSPSTARGRRIRTGVLSAAVLLLIPVVVVAGDDAFRAALDFTTGVLSLVSLTASVVWGLVASDRLFLTSRQRLLAQGVHRATAIASLGFLLLHVSVKLALAHVSPAGALIPFGTGFSGSSGLIGLGVLAGLLMVTTGVTGALRSSMASPARLATRWRATHMLAYPAWCLALVHGLYAGRQPKTYVVVLYSLCLVAVAGAVALRAAPPPVKRAVAARILALLAPGPAAPAPEPPARPATEPFVRPEATPAPPPTRAPAGVGFSAAYRAVSAAPPPPYPEPYPEPPLPEPPNAPRWPTPSPPPPAQAPPPPTYASESAPYEEAGSYGAPFQAPSAGEPWGTPPARPYEEDQPYGGTW
ncbi:hypothetical protein ACFW9D_32000 [Streptomyces sp. NPDC059524]|uniref:hypothetical protein n=1 Tax=Streptomyces sp. NPDC059524 TaxID=3346856 RepID=UPI0036A8BA08